MKFVQFIILEGSISNRLMSSKVLVHLLAYDGGKAHVAEAASVLCRPIDQREFLNSYGLSTSFSRF